MVCQQIEKISLRCLMEWKVNQITGPVMRETQQKVGVLTRMKNLQPFSALKICSMILAKLNIRGTKKSEDESGSNNVRSEASLRNGIFNGPNCSRGSKTLEPPQMWG